MRSRCPTSGPRARRVVGPREARTRIGAIGRDDDAATTPLKRARTATTRTDTTAARLRQRGVASLPSQPPSLRRHWAVVIDAAEAAANDDDDTVTR